MIYSKKLNTRKGISIKSQGYYSISSIYPEGDVNLLEWKSASIQTWKGELPIKPSTYLPEVVKEKKKETIITDDLAMKIEKFIRNNTE